MWTSKEAARALRESKASLLQQWQAAVQERLWHLDQTLFTRKGKATRCANRTIIALIDYHQNRQFRPAEPAVSPENVAEVTFGQEAAETSPPSLAETEAPDTLPDLTPPSARCTPRTFLEEKVQFYADAWIALPLPWADIRAMLELLCTLLHQSLTERGADPDTIQLGDALLAAIATLVADQRILQAEQEFARHREEYAMTQHLAGRLLANASHELRTPLTAILGFADLLLEETYGPIQPEQRTAINHIENSAQNLLEVINNLLDMLRIRSGKIALQHRLVAVSPLLAHLYHILTPLAERKNVSFQQDVPEDLSVIEADENILRHIVYNLLASALRATPAGGTVILRALRDETTLTITTHDTALHLPPEALANMAELFPRLENSPARGYEGWEVGLPLVRRYVELHDGTFLLESEPGQGTTFRISLPVARNVVRVVSA